MDAALADLRGVVETGLAGQRTLDQYTSHVHIGRRLLLSVLQFQRQIRRTVNTQRANANSELNGPYLDFRLLIFYCNIFASSLNKHTAATRPNILLAASLYNQ